MQKEVTNQEFWLVSDQRNCQMASLTQALDGAIALIHYSRHVGFQIVMQISQVLCWGQTLE